MTTAASILESFARRTGVTGSAPPRRYLWTDAFAVSACLALHRRAQSEGRAAADAPWLGLAVRIVEQVHHILGRHRRDDARTGWISGLDEEEGARHPTAGGLRIGKPLPERRPGEPSDARLEWEQDGQYYHYLTRWMHALARVGAATLDPRYHRWAVELALAAHRGFVRGTGGGPQQMCWKMSVDLSRPLVRSTGHHDPLDGLMTLASLRATAPAPAQAPGQEPVLAEELDGPIRELAEMCRGRDWTTDDALGIGAILDAAHRAWMLARSGGVTFGDGSDLPGSVAPEALLRDAASSLDMWARLRPPGLPDHYRLPFRELGLAIGLVAVEGAGEAAPPEIARHRPVADDIRDHWLDLAHQTASTWTDHLDINAVMLATLLAPEEHVAL
jgi:hypothetical protein